MAMPEHYLSWTDPDENGDISVELHGVPFSLLVFGATREEALHRLGDALCVAYADACPECKGKDDLSAISHVAAAGLSPDPKEPAQ